MRQDLDFVRNDMNVQNRNAEPNGALVINKHNGVTSHDIVNKVRRL